MVGRSSCQRYVPTYEMKFCYRKALRRSNLVILHYVIIEWPLNYIRFILDLHVGLSQTNVEGAMFVLITPYSSELSKNSVKNLHIRFDENGGTSTFFRPRYSAQTPDITQSHAKKRGSVPYASNRIRKTFFYLWTRTFYLDRKSLLWTKRFGLIGAGFV